MSDSFSAEPAQPARRGRGKLFLGLGIGCGVLVLLCCGGVGLMYSYVGNMMSLDPDEVRATTAEITTIDIPPDLEPQMRLSAGAPFADKPAMQMAVYGNDDEEMILLMQLPLEEEVDEEEFRNQFRTQLRGQMAAQGRSVPQLAETETREIKLDIRGESCTFELLIGEDSQSGKQLIQADGGFPAKGGKGWIMILVDGETHSAEDVEAILGSIR